MDKLPAHLALAGEQHSAPGQMAGYLFQLERAVAWLARSPAGSTIGVETGDDIVAVSPGGEVREQDKHSISATRKPLGDSSRELWNTLGIWLDAIKQNPGQSSSIKFFIATNKTVDSAALVKRIGEADTEAEIDVCVKSIRAIGENITGDLKALAQKVLSFSNEEIAFCVKHIVLVDGAQASAGSALKDQVASDLHLPPSFDKDEFHRSLIGWLSDIVIGLWRSGQPAWVTRDSFDQYAQTLRLRLVDRRIRERARHLLSLPAVDPSQHQDRTFVKQIQLVIMEAELDASIIEAVEDYMGASGERIRLSQEGSLTKDDLIAFDNRLKTRWKSIYDTAKRSMKGEIPADAKVIGAEVLHDTLDHRESLAGQQTEEYYLTRGSYHGLAEEKEVGWHPDFPNLLDGK